ncbi:MAG TPA: AbrB/MazE/SpoVT family DNA-binding domain-containing protein [Terriglobales bacterium]|nr:AbrB/MazE/SpoVT family DNA-binding domain-containing protein [Terriglobales bacterium]
MRSHVTIDRAGRIVVPKPVREALGLSADAVLDIELQGEELKLRPRRASGRLRKKQGIWVLAATPGGRGLSAAEYQQAIDRVREERSRVVRGEGR